MSQFSATALPEPDEALRLLEAAEFAAERVAPRFPSLPRNLRRALQHHATASASVEEAVAELLNAAERFRLIARILRKVDDAQGHRILWKLHSLASRDDLTPEERDLHRDEFLVRQADAHLGGERGGWIFEVGWKRVGLGSPARRVIGVDPSGQQRLFASVAEAGRFVDPEGKTSKQRVVDCCRGRASRWRGWRFRYADEG